MINTPAYSNLQTLAKPFKKQHLNDLFAETPNRFEPFHARMDGLLLDFSKQKLGPEVVSELIEMANQCQLKDKIEALFAGEPINNTEKRAAWHTALRDLDNPPPEVSAEWAKMAVLVNQLHDHQLRGYSGKAITDVINIGVGGSDLGPLMVTHALERDKHPQAPNVYFVSTLDGRQLEKLFHELNPETTLFIIASKSFATIDTLSLAETAKAWIQNSAGSQSATMHHFIGISTKPDKMTEWGIFEQHQLTFWDWVGGRYSLWSSIGLSIAFQLGMTGYKALLSGANALDTHFKTVPFNQNIPVLLAMIGIWNTNFLNLSAQAILPYDSRLKYFASYLEQLEMESNGKRTKRDGTEVSYRTCPILWGEVGPNAQHAFYQLLHQGTERVMSDFILSAQGPSHSDRSQFHQNLNIANCLAQSRAMMTGESADDLHKNYPGDQVSNTLLLDTLDAYHLGLLIALYEQKVFVQSVIWDINPFDQWGVELGKKLAQSILNNIENQSTDHLDSSTEGILHNIWEINRGDKS